jgi:hypothetical protein
MANTVASVSRQTGIEGGIRRYLGDRRPSDSEQDDSRKRKRLRQASPEADVERGLSPKAYNAAMREPARELPMPRGSRAASQASLAESLHSLPPYDENRSPRYEELAPLLLQQDRDRDQPQSPSRNWRTQLMITTSGLGAALSEASLNNLRACLKLLHTATNHLATVMHAIKRLLEDYNQGSTQGAQSSSPQGMSYEQEEASNRIAARIKEFHHDIMSTLEVVKNSISRYTGGALPENAGALVRRQLMSIPQRWRVAESTAESQNGTTQSEPVRSGNKLLAFTGQSLDMIAQVTLIVGATIENAEGWLERMGKKKQRERERLEGSNSSTNGSKNQMMSPPQPQQTSIKQESEKGDVVMGDSKSGF